MRSLRSCSVSLRALVIAAAIAGAGTGCHRGPPLPAGDLAASLALPTLGADGARFDPATLRGKRVLLAFWRPSCPHCLHELPELEAAVARRDDAIAVAVVSSANQETALAVAREHGFTGPVLVDDGGTLQHRLGIDRLPWTFVLRADGTAASQLIGAQPQLVLVDELDDAD